MSHTPEQGDLKEEPLTPRVSVALYLPLIGGTAQPQRAPPPRQWEFTPASAAKFVICDHTIELTIKELKSGLHLGQMQVTKEAERVARSVALPVVAYLLLIRLYGHDALLAPEGSLFKLKARFTEDVVQEHVIRTERKWQRKLKQLRRVA